MITKRLTAFMTAFAILFTLVQFNTGMEVKADSAVPVIDNGRLVLFDFGCGSDGNLGTDTADKYRELSTDVCDMGKTSSLLWTFPETANLNVEVRIDYQRQLWPEGADVKFRMYNGHTEDNTFVLYFYTLSSDYTPIYREFVTLNPGWNTVTMSRSKLDNAIPLENDIGVKFNVGGWRKSNPYVYTVGSKIYIDSAYIEYPDYGKTIAGPTPSIENGAGYVASDLENNNIYTLTFSEKLWSGAHTEGNTKYIPKDYVTVYEKNGASYEETSRGYDVLVNSDGRLDIVFDSELDNAIYKVVANSDAILTSTGKKLESDAVYYFSVGMESVIFTATSAVPSDASGIIASDPGFEYTINFNNKLGGVSKSSVSILEAGKNFNSYSVSSNDNKLTITFNDALKANTEYTITLSDELCDSNDSPIYGNREFKFTTANTADGDGILYAASRAGDIEAIEEFDKNSYKLEHVTEGAGIGEKTVKITKKLTNTNPYSVDFSNKIVSDITKFKYLNCRVYVPEENDEGFAVILGDTRDGGTGQLYKKITTDWTGWKTVSFPITELQPKNNMGNYVNQTVLGFNRETPPYCETAGSFILVDAIWFSHKLPSELALTSSSIPDGYKNAALIGEVLSFNFTSDLDDSTAVQILIADSAGNTINDYEYSINGKNITIVLGQLQPLGKYTLKLDGLMSKDFSKLSEAVALSFTAASDGVYVKNLSYDNKSVSVGIENLSASDASVTLVAYAISDGNKLLDKVQKNIAAVRNTVTSDSVSFDTTGEIKEVKAFVYDENGCFLSNKYLGVSDDVSDINYVSYLPGTVADIESDTVLDADLLSCEAVLAGVSNAAVAELVSPDGKLISANVANADTEGKLTYGYTFPSSAPTGIYTLTISSDKCTASDDIRYVSAADRDEFLNLSNNGTASALDTKLKKLAKYFELSSTDDDRIEDFVSFILSNKPFDNYLEAVDFVKSLDKLLNDINSATWGELTALIKKNSEILGGDDNENIAYFMNLSEEKKNAISQDIIAVNSNADTISEFLSKLSDAVDAAKKAQKTTSTGSSAGSSSFGGGSVSGSFPAVPDAKPYTPIEENTIFTDLKDTPWAADSILTLYKKSVISPSADNRFRPLDMVTREEFVKMIVCAFLENAGTSSHRFADETDGAWYSPYLSKAYYAGIAFGYPDGRFGVGENISREDMVTICSRTLESLGENINTSADSNFSDASYISDYASGYVNAMAQLGVVNGVGDGSFAPKKNATRAEAAKVIAKLLELY